MKIVKRLTRVLVALAIALIITACGGGGSTAATGGGVITPVTVLFIVASHHAFVAQLSISISSGIPGHQINFRQLGKFRSNPATQGRVLRYAQNNQTDPGNIAAGSMSGQLCIQTRIIEA